MLFYEFSLPPSATTGPCVPPAGCITAGSSVATVPADFAAWLRAAHAETTGSAQQAYERVAHRLGITLGGLGADHG